MLRLLRSLFFKGGQPRYLWVWELEETLVRLAVFRLDEAGAAATLGFGRLRKESEEPRAEFWARACRSLWQELGSNVPRQARRGEVVFLIGAGLMRLWGAPFKVQRREAGRELAEEEVEEHLLNILPRVRESLKGNAATSFGLERHELSIVDGVLDSVLLEGRLLERTQSLKVGGAKKLGRELTFNIFLVFAPKTVVQDFGALIRRLNLREFVLLPLLLPLSRWLQTLEPGDTTGAIAFFDEEWTELVFLSDSKPVRNTVLSVGMRTLREAVGSAVGFAGQAEHDLFAFWASGKVSRRTSHRLQELLTPTFTLLHEVLFSALSPAASSARDTIWLFGPGRRIAGLEDALGATPQPASYEKMYSWFAIPEELGPEYHEIVPLAAAAWFVATLRAESPWQERFIRTLRLMQR